MAGLNLIQSYLSDSEDSDNEEKPEIKCNSSLTPAKSTFQRLPVPQSILSLKGVEHHEDVHDDPTMHDGRKRSFKHERGNWATLVYLDYPDNNAIHSWLRKINEKLGIDDNLKTFNEFHLSLTRSLILKFHWIESFVDGVRNLCQNTDQITIEFGEVKVYCNEERTRTFLGIRCQDISKNLESLVTNLDKLLAEYKLPPFYEESSFHISILWCLGDMEEKLNSQLPLLNESLNRAYTEQSLQSYIKISDVYCKIGNKMYKFSLKG